MKQNPQTFSACAMVSRCFASEFPTIWVSVTEAFFCAGCFFLLAVFFVGPLDFAGDVVLLLSPLLPADNKPFSSFSC